MPAPTKHELQAMYSNIVNDYRRWEQKSRQAKEQMKNVDTLPAREAEDVREFERLTVDEALSLRRQCTRLTTYQSSLDSATLSDVLNMEKTMKPAPQIPPGYGMAPK